MFKGITLLATVPSIGFMHQHRRALALSGLLVALSIASFVGRGLDYGIDFRGGVMIEAAFSTPPVIDPLRDALEAADLGDIEIQSFGADDTILIRVQEQDGGEKERIAAIAKIKSILGSTIGGDIDYRRTEFVGPKIGEELKWQGIWAVTYAIIAMLLYIWFRFDGWAFAIAAIIALLHDVVLTLGLFSIFALEFNLATIAAILTIAGYSINDTVVVFDRVRENRVKHRSRSLGDIFDLSLNETLSRTLITSLTTLLALCALVIFGGAVIRDFVLAMIWGVVIGTWSSIFIAVPMLEYLKLAPATSVTQDSAP